MIITLHERLLTPHGRGYVEACRAAAVEHIQQTITFDTTTAAYRQLVIAYPRDHPALLVKRKARPVAPPRDQGLGDTLARLLHALRIPLIVKRIAGAKCGCDRRQRWLNRVVPYR